MGVEDTVLKILHRLEPKPTFREAQKIVLLREVHDEALYAANSIRDVAIEIDLRLRDLGHRPRLNHRGFMVGGLGVGIVPSVRYASRHTWFAFAAWNTKPYPTDHPDDKGKICAETRIGDAMLARHCTCMLCLAVVAETNTGGDGRSGKHGPGPTLDPCEVCRDNMRGKYYELYKHDTAVILTENAKTGVRAPPRSIQELMDHHREPWWRLGANVVPLTRGG